ncbi:hypothetical protein ACFFGV_10270 [Pontibacillus salicampi]|uniref:DUF3993 domain-containing protein n=1 Tax=Pontibacillus salicampi TaxID=1449801 RepID=A0ABV6LNH3_9BACI
MKRSIFAGIAIVMITMIMFISITLPQPQQLMSQEEEAATSEQHGKRTESSFHKKEKSKHFLSLSSSVQAEGSQLSEKKMEELIHTFYDKLIQETDERNFAVDYTSKDALIESFTSISTTKLAKEYVDFYYKEYNNELYLVPTETPAWFVKGNDYQVKQSSENQVKLTQRNQSDLYGNYTITFTFAQQDGKWKLVGIEHK